LSHVIQVEAMNEQLTVMEDQLDIMEIEFTKTYIEYPDPLEIEIAVKKMRKFMGKFWMNPWMS